MIIIPIGIDCGLADLCKKYNLRSSAFPFDWNVSYSGVSKCIEEEFKNFTEPLTNKINMYNIFFVHDFIYEELIESDKKKYIRRCERLIDILKNSKEEIIFFRKGHECNHHKENSNVCNDINDSEKLDSVILNKYPNLKYKIIVTLVCDKCFQPCELYKSNSKNIEIYNIASSRFNNKKFEELFCHIFKI